MKKTGFSMALSSKRLTHAVLASTLFVSSSYAGNIAGTVGPQVMSAQGDNQITVLQTGQINVVTPNDGILVDSDNASITLSPNNINPGNNAIITSLAALNGITVGSAGTGNNTNISVGANANIDSSQTADGVFINANAVILVNDGTITGKNAGIELGALGTNPIIVNESTGTITGAPLFGAAIIANGTGLGLLNQGTISGGTGRDAIALNAAITQLQNDANGLISSDQNAINIAVNPISGTIINDGTITTTGGPGVAAINYGKAFGGTLTNDAGAVIQATGALGNAIRIAAPFNSIENKGTIQSTTGEAIIVSSLATGTIENSNLIASTTGNTISLANGLTDITNTLSGTITALNPTNAVIYASAPGVVVTNGITNSGKITHQAGGVAIDLQTAGANIDVKLTQLLGTITGDVLLASKGGTVLNMVAGTIDGNVTAANFNANTLNIAGGTITKTLTLGNAGDTLNLVDGSLQAIVGGTGADTINYSGGSFTTLNGGPGLDTLNLNTSYTTNGSIASVETINLNNSGTVFTVNNTITGLDTLLKLNSGTTLNANNTITGVGALQNSGTLNIANNQTVTLSGAATNSGVVDIGVGGVLNVFSYTQTPTGNYSLDILNGNNGKILVAAGGGNLQAGSTVAPTPLSGQFIPEGTKFDIMVASGVGTITDNSSLIQPSSVIYNFEKNVVGGGKILQLTTHRNTFSSFAPNPPINGVAGALDAIVQQGPVNPDIVNLLGQLDAITSTTDMQNALLMLAPSANYAMIEASRIGMNNAFATIERRVEDMRGLHYIWEKDRSGINYGDPCPSRAVCPPGPTTDCPPFREPLPQGSCREYCYPNFDVYDEAATPLLHGGTTWIAGYGSIIYQNDRNNYLGYDVKAVGFGVGSDYDISETTTMGLAFHYTQAKANTPDVVVQEQRVDSYQGTFYVQSEPMESMYLDGMFGVVSDSYKISRNIDFLNIMQNANAKFRGFHYGGQVDIGYLLNSEGYLVVPFMRFRASRLEINSYTEEDAGGIGLSVERDDLNEFLGAIGLRLAFKKDFADATYVPEATLMVGYDFIADGQNLISNFVGQGPSFTTIGITPPRTSYTLGLGVDVHTADHFIFKVKWEVQERDQYLNNTGYLQLWYRFSELY